MVGKGGAAVYAYKKVKKYITPQIKDKVEAKLDEWFHDNVAEVEPLYLESKSIATLFLVWTSLGLNQGPPDYESQIFGFQ